MIKPEILAPAGNLIKLKTAIDFGADAVYIGGEEFSLRTAAENFSFDDMKKGVEYAHERGKKVHVACNIVARNEDIEAFKQYIQGVKECGVDAVIISDIGLIELCKKYAPGLEIHASTQANITNYETCRVLYNMGVKRVVLARELSMTEVSQIRKNTPPELEIETFVHGSMCMSHSGRCVLSNYMTNRDSNRGNCAQPCRWKYYLMEEKRPGQYMPVYEDEKGTFILNSKDMCMIEYIPELIEAGVTSFKIEGRVKSEYYVATIAAAYRRAVDMCFSDINEYMEKKVLLKEEVCKVSHRDYYTGFYFEENNLNTKDVSMVYTSNSYIRDYEVIGICVGYNENIKQARIVQRNKFSINDKIEVLSPGMEPFEINILEMYNENDEKIEAAPHPEMLVKFYCEHKINPGSFLRRAKPMN